MHHRLSLEGLKESIQQFWLAVRQFLRTQLWQIRPLFFFPLLHCLHQAKRLELSQWSSTPKLFTHSTLRKLLKVGLLTTSLPVEVQQLNLELILMLSGYEQLDRISLQDQLAELTRTTPPKRHQRFRLILLALLREAMVGESPSTKTMSSVFGITQPKLI